MGVGHLDPFALKVVTPAKAGVQWFCYRLKFLDTGFHRYDAGCALLTYRRGIEEVG